MIDNFSRLSDILYMPYNPRFFSILKNSLAFYHRKILKYFIVFFLLFPTWLFAEWRTYQLKGKPASFLEKFLQVMEKGKKKFRIKKVYNSKSDAKEGFILEMIRSSKEARFLFFSKPKTKKFYIKIFTQDEIDASYFHHVLVKKIRAKEIGVSKIPETKDNWLLRKY